MKDDLVMAVDSPGDKEAGIEGFYTECRFGNIYVDGFTKDDIKFVKDVLSDLYDVPLKYIYKKN